MKGNIEERACDLAVYIIENRTTVRAAAKKFGVSKSTVHKDIQDRLPQINPASTFRSRRSLRSTKPSGTFAAASPREKNIRELETFSSEFRQIKAETDQTPHGRPAFFLRRPRKLFFPLVVC
jgi:putative DeoR family transcriptional regulator (stage III sporulation protein D)